MQYNSSALFVGYIIYFGLCTLGVCVAVSIDAVVVSSQFVFDDLCSSFELPRVPFVQRVSGPSSSPKCSHATGPWISSRSGGKGSEGSVDYGRRTDCIARCTASLSHRASHRRRTKPGRVMQSTATGAAPLMRRVALAHARWR
jgi:hypothetical protein